MSSSNAASASSTPSRPRRQAPQKRLQTYSDLSSDNESDTSDKYQKGSVKRKKLGKFSSSSDSDNSNHNGDKSSAVDSGSGDDYEAEDTHESASEAPSQSNTEDSDLNNEKDPPFEKKNKHKKRTKRTGKNKVAAFISRKGEVFQKQPQQQQPAASQLLHRGNAPPQFSKDFELRKVAATNVSYSANLDADKSVKHRAQLQVLLDKFNMGSNSAVLATNSIASRGEGAAMLDLLARCVVDREGLVDSLKLGQEVHLPRTYTRPWLHFREPMEDPIYPLPLGSAALQRIFDGHNADNNDTNSLDIPPAPYAQLSNAELKVYLESLSERVPQLHVQWPHGTDTLFGRTPVLESAKYAEESQKYLDPQSSAKHNIATKDNFDFNTDRVAIIERSGETKINAGFVMDTGQTGLVGAEWMPLLHDDKDNARNMPQILAVASRVSMHVQLWALFSAEKDKKVKLQTPKLISVINLFDDDAENSKCKGVLRFKWMPPIGADDNTKHFAILDAMNRFRIYALSLNTIIDTKQTILRLTHSVEYTCPNTVTSFAVHPHFRNNGLVAVGTRRGELKVLRVEHRKKEWGSGFAVLQSSFVHGMQISAIEWNPAVDKSIDNTDESVLFSVAVDGTIMHTSALALDSSVEIDSAYTATRPMAYCATMQILLTYCTQDIGICALNPQLASGRRNILSLGSAPTSIATSPLHPFFAVALAEGSVLISNGCTGHGPLYRSKKSVPGARTVVPLFAATHKPNTFTQLPPYIVRGTGKNNECKRTAFTQPPSSAAISSVTWNPNAPFSEYIASAFTESGLVRVDRVAPSAQSETLPLFADREESFTNGNVSVEGPPGARVLRLHSVNYKPASARFQAPLANIPASAGTGTTAKSSAKPQTKENGGAVKGRTRKYARYEGEINPVTGLPYPPQKVYVYEKGKYKKPKTSHKSKEKPDGSKQERNPTETRGRKRKNTTPGDEHGEANNNYNDQAVLTDPHMGSVSLDPNNADHGTELSDVVDPSGSADGDPAPSKALPAARRRGRPLKIPEF